MALETAEHRLTRPDGRTVAWAGWGPAESQPVLRIHGTPGCRWPARTDPSPWSERGVRMIMAERAGYGASSPHAGYGVLDHVDDLVAILDHAGVDRLPVVGASGAAPYVLALAATHPSRVTAASVAVGAAPLEDDEVDGMIEVNRVGHRLAEAGEFDAIRELLREHRDAVMADPLGAFTAIMAEAPPADAAVLNDPEFRSGFADSVTEALRQGIDGWFDDNHAIHFGWDEFDLSRIACPVTWWHAADDRNAPLSAAKRVVDQIPDVTMRVWDEGGHLLTYHHEGDILDDLLARHASVEQI